MATGGALPFCADAEIKPINKDEVDLIGIRDTVGLSELVKDLHGKGKCPHLLTLDNIFRIAKTAIEQVRKNMHNWKIKLPICNRKSEKQKWKL